MWRVICSLGLWLAGIGAFAGLVPNAGFAEGADGMLAAWRLGKAAIPAGEGVASPEGVLVAWEPADGGCLRMTGSGRAAGDYALVSSPRLRVLPGFSYELTCRYHAEGLLPENGDRSRYAALILDIFFENAKGFVGASRLMTTSNTAGWVPLTKLVSPPPGTAWAQLRLSLVNKYPGVRPVIRWDEVTLTPQDPTLPDPGFESGAGWTAEGAATTARVTAPVHAGAYALAVTDAPAGRMAGWSCEVPVRPDRAYAANGFCQGGDLAADGPLAGGALGLQFLDAAGQPVGEPVFSPAVPAQTAWTRIATPRTRPPAEAQTLRLTAGLQFCRGTAWFDDLALVVDMVPAADAPRIRRSPAASPTVTYAPNLLPHGDVEAGTGETPAGWTFMGRAAPDWTAEEITRLHTEGRPPFAIGRARGEWSRETTYAGRGALLTISVDPPLSPNHQWYGRNPVDGYWLSDAMPCTPGTAYLAGAWLRPGAVITEAWYGPLELRFFDAKGTPRAPANHVRSAIGEALPGVWSYWATMPHVAPPDAATMRLRVGQELKADAGGWGRTVADNLAVWALPAGAPVPAAEEVGLATARFRAWFRTAHATVKPPYLAAPADAVAYESCWVTMTNAVPGNLYTDTAMPVRGRVMVTNLLGEARTLTLRLTRTDWLGAAAPVITTPPITMAGYAEAGVPITLPPTRRYGAFHLEIEVLEDGVAVGHDSGRYAVLPPRTRPHAVTNIWGATPLVRLRGDNSPFEQELGTLLQAGGFGIAWVRLYFNLAPTARAQAVAKVQQICAWYRSLGIQPVVQLIPEITRPVNRVEYEAVGRELGLAFKGQAAALGNHGIEQANSASPFRGGGAARITDAEFDTVMAGLYDGIKLADPAQTVLIGNIATDWETKTVTRLYGPPVSGRFDGAILNAYLGLVMTARNNAAAFDQHGDTRKTIWQEENADQRSPVSGEGRRYGEGEGAANLVRSWLSLAAALGPRLRAMTAWGFASDNEMDSELVTPTLQPRPHFVAHAVMADALADATFTADQSTAAVTALAWRRRDDTLLVAWSTTAHPLTVTTPTKAITVMDLMGNRITLPVTGGKVAVPLTATPVYVAGKELGVGK